MIAQVYRYLFPATPRYLSTNNDAIAVDSFDPKLHATIKQLDALTPRFTSKASQIDILNDPKHFYQTLCRKISGARRHVFLSTLYVGRKQQDLVDCIAGALDKNPDLHVHILTDALRGTREAPDTCCASLMVPLVAKFGPRVDLRMYHTPHLKGFTKAVTPKRINEAWGLQHMKLYGFDDEIILSGANLSQDYFTDRQDRYYVFSNKNITNYYHKIHKAISSLSYQVLPAKSDAGFRLYWPSSNSSCEPHVNTSRFISDSSFLLEPLLKQHDLTAFEEHSDDGDFDTLVYPVSQFTPLLPQDNDSSTEKPCILRLLAYLDSPNIKWWFTAGYFNMLPEIQQRLMNGAAQGTIITASAKANSFYKSSGVAYYLPEAYLLIARKFLEDIKKHGKEGLIKLYEWQNGIVNTANGWSYHAKGIWITTPEEEVPSITVIGSSNYTKRAYSLDLESNAIIITKNPELKQKMKHEIDHLMKHSKQLELEDFSPKMVSPETTDENGKKIKAVYETDEDKKISYGVHLALKLIGGKL